MKVKNTKKIITLRLALRLQAILCTALLYLSLLHLSLRHAPLHAEITSTVYDFTATSYENGIVEEYKNSDRKTLQVYNGSTRKIYIRIGYGYAEGHFCKTCLFTGFILNPGQTGKVYKYAACVPINVTGTFITKNGTKIADIPNGIIATNMNDTGTVQWDVTDQGGISYKGAWTENGWKKSPKYDPAECK